ncbi:hypothetical protein BDZ97DRAFT_2062060 [Flammula alnicola]|nr:hypothetical protein BDZ97DRAFT_2062060 [Flammula alnicola]
MRVSFIVLTILGVIASSSAIALESRNGGNPQCCDDCFDCDDNDNFGCKSRDDFECLCKNNDWCDGMEKCFRDKCDNDDDFKHGKKRVDDICEKNLSFSIVVGESSSCRMREVSGITLEIDTPIATSAKKQLL